PRPGELACAAALLFQRSANARAHQPGLAGWHNAGRATWRFVLRHGEHKHEVELHTVESGQQPLLHAQVGDTRLTLRLLASDGRWATLELDGIRHRHAYHLAAERIWLYGHAGNLEFTD